MVKKEIGYMLLSFALVVSWKMMNVVGDVFAPRTIEPYFIYKVIHKPTSDPVQDEATKASCFNAKLSIKLSKTYSDGVIQNEQKELHLKKMIARNSSHDLPFNLSVDKLETIYYEPMADLKKYLLPADGQPYDITSIVAEVVDTPKAAGNRVCKSYDQKILMILKYTNGEPVTFDEHKLLTISNGFFSTGIQAQDMPGIHKFIDKGRAKHKHDVDISFFEKLKTAYQNHFRKGWVFRSILTAGFVEKLFRILIGLLSLVIMRRENPVPQDTFFLREDLLIIQAAFAIFRNLGVTTSPSHSNSLDSSNQQYFNTPRTGGHSQSNDHSQSDSSNWRDPGPPLYRPNDFRSNDDTQEHSEPTDRALNALKVRGVKNAHLPNSQPSVHNHHRNDDSCADDDIEAARKEQPKLLDDLKIKEETHEISNDLSWNDDDMKAIKAFLNCSGIEKGAGDQKTKAKDD